MGQASQLTPSPLGLLSTASNSLKEVRAWQCIAAILALGGLRQRVQEFEASLGQAGIRQAGKQARKKHYGDTLCV